MREARAYNQSIYLMVAMPYTLFGIGVFAIYRACRKAKKAQEAAALSQEHTIRVLSVSPGFIETDMTDTIPTAIREKYLGMIPAKRFGNVNDVADTIAFLMSDKASYINGTNIHINGGII